MPPLDHIRTVGEEARHGLVDEAGGEVVQGKSR